MALPLFLSKLLSRTGIARHLPAVQRLTERGGDLARIALVEVQHHAGERHAAVDRARLRLDVERRVLADLVLDGRLRDRAERMRNAR